MALFVPVGDRLVLFKLSWRFDLVTAGFHVDLLQNTYADC